MLRYIRGELYRLLHKKSLYIYFGALALGYFLVAFIRSGGFGENSIISDAANLFTFLPVLAGGCLFAAVCTDDLNAKSLATLVGFGMGKTKIVLAKLCLMALLSAAAFGLVPLFHCGVYAMLGCAPGAGDWAMLYALTLKFLLSALAFAVLSGVMVYGAQRVTFAVVLYILLAFNVASGLASAVLNMDFVTSLAPNLSSHLMSGISDRIFIALTGGGSMIRPAVEYVIYVAIAAALSIIAFRKKEMEFWP